MPERKSTLMTFVGGNLPPTLSEAASILGLAERDLHAGFGVIEIDPERRLYAVEVLGDGIPNFGADRESDPFRGPYSNPKIVSFGPARGPDED